MFKKCNAYLHPNLQIAKISWLTQIIAEIFFSTEIENKNKKMVNRLITESLFKKLKIKNQKLKIKN